MKEALLKRIKREFMEVLESIDEGRVHHDGDDFHEILRDIDAALAQQADHSEQHLDMVKAQQEPWCMKMNGCKTKCEDCPVEVVEQEPVNAWLIFDKDNEPLIVSSDLVTTKKYKEAGRRVEQLAYYTTPPQRTWVGLTDEEFQYCVELKNSEAIAEEVEAKLKEKNT